MKKNACAWKPGMPARMAIQHGKVFTQVHKKELLEQGWTIVRDILSEDDCSQLIQRSHEWAEGLGMGIDCSDASTWKSDRWPHHTHGILKHGDVGHSDWVWDARRKVEPIFRDIYNTSRLVTSFDGVSFDPPQEHTRMLQDIEGKALMHVDQSAAKTGLHSVQGFVTLFDIDDCDTTLRIVPGSHKVQQKLVKRLFEATGVTEEAEKKKLLASGWHQFPDELLQKIVVEEFGLEVLRVVMPAGSMVLWDSRTVHGKGGPKLPRTIPKWRIVVYVCMTPARWCTKATLKKRIKAFEEVRMTNHCPHNVRLNAAKPRTYGSLKLEEKWARFDWRTTPPELNEGMMGLVGYPYL